MTVAAYLAHGSPTRPAKSPRGTRECYQEIMDTNIAPLIGNLVGGKLLPADVARMNSTALERGRKDGRAHRPLGGDDAPATVAGAEAGGSVADDRA